MSPTDTSDETESDLSQQTERAQLGRIRRGAEGGAVATLVMTAYRLPVSRSLPPTAEFWSKFVSGDDPYEHPVVALVLHVVYGVLAGIGFGLLVQSRESVDGASGVGPPAPSGEVRLTILGLIYGLVLSAIGEKVVLGTMLEIDPDDWFAFHIGHVLYGITLGAWVGTRTTE